MHKILCVHVGTVFAGSVNPATGSCSHRQVGQLTGQRFTAATGHFKHIKVESVASICRGIGRQLLPIAEEHPRPFAVGDLEHRFTTANGLRDTLSSSIELDRFPPRHITHVEMAAFFFFPGVPNNARTIFRDRVPDLANFEKAEVTFISSIAAQESVMTFCAGRLAIGQHADELQLPRRPLVKTRYPPVLDGV